jgi:hypothetical protein
MFGIEVLARNNLFLCLDGVLARHNIRLHLLSSDKSSAPPNELAEDLIDLVRAYLK